MKAEVIKEYRDRYTGVLHKVGEEFEVTSERYHEINGAAHGPYLKELKPTKKTKK